MQITLYLKQYPQSEAVVNQESLCNQLPDVLSQNIFT